MCSVHISFTYNKGVLKADGTLTIGDADTLPGRRDAGREADHDHVLHHPRRHLYTPTPARSCYTAWTTGIAGRDSLASLHEVHLHALELKDFQIFLRSNKAWNIVLDYRIRVIRDYVRIFGIQCERASN